MLVMRLSRHLGVLIAAMLFECQHSVAHQAVLLGRGAVPAERTRSPGKPASARKPTRKVRKGGKKLFGDLLKLANKGPPALPSMLPSAEHPALKDDKAVSSQTSHKALKKAPPQAIFDENDNPLNSVEYDEFDITTSTSMRVLDAVLLLAFGIFVANSFADIRSFWVLLFTDLKKDRSPCIVANSSQDAGAWSITMLVGLTAYRFYTGFLTATWLPYLLAMEGQYLWSSNQSMFMGCAKLIYGATILTNPILGLVGDRAVRLSHGVGRRLFVRIGVAFAAVGILLCMVAAYIEYFYTFMFGIFIWRMGEAINDVTTEALVPELVPAEQFQVASAVKAALFLFGGLFGYLLLIAAAGIHYSWLYYAYFIGMIVTCMPVLILLDNDAPRQPTSARQRQETSFSTQMVEAYLAPARAGGGFPRACLAVFVFSLGTAPMFFLLLLVRDVIGIKDAVQLQEHFSGSSIMFFLSAAFAAVMSGARTPRPPSVDTPSSRTQMPELSVDAQRLQSAEDPPLVKSIVRMTMCVTLFAVLCFCLPWVGLLSSMEARTVIFYVIATVFGYSFGLSFSQFQGITWQLLPPGIDLANAMGFNVMSRLLGLGVGNFIAGLILDFFYVDTYGVQMAPDDPLQTSASRQVEGEYRFMGYVTMCTASGIATLIAAMLSYSIAQQYRLEDKLPQKPTSSSGIAAAG